MAVKTRVEPLEREVALIVDQDLSPEAQSRALAGFAREALAEAQEANRQTLGRVPPHDTFVDGRAGVAIDQVSPSGTVIFEFELFFDVLIFIAAELRAVSPVRTGRYRASHALFADGLEVAVTGNVPPADEYVFLSAVPYARKIEGRKGRRGISRQAPKGVYEVTAAKASRRFGNVARVRFTYRAPAGAAGRFPAIVVTPR